MIDEEPWHHPEDTPPVAAVYQVWDKNCEWANMNSEEPVDSGGTYFSYWNGDRFCYRAFGMEAGLTDEQKILLALAMVDEQTDLPTRTYWRHSEHSLVVYGCSELARRVGPAVMKLINIRRGNDQLA